MGGGGGNFSSGKLNALQKKDLSTVRSATERAFGYSSDAKVIAVTPPSQKAYYNGILQQRTQFLTERTINEIKVYDLWEVSGASGRRQAGRLTQGGGSFTSAEEALKYSWYKNKKNWTKV